MARIDPGAGEHKPAPHTRESAEAARKALRLSGRTERSARAPSRLPGSWVLVVIVLGALLCALVYGLLDLLGMTL